MEKSKSVVYLASKSNDSETIAKTHDDRFTYTVPHPQRDWEALLRLVRDVLKKAEEPTVVLLRHRMLVDVIQGKKKSKKNLGVLEDIRDLMIRKGHEVQESDLGRYEHQVCVWGEPGRWAQNTFLSLPRKSE